MSARELQVMVNSDLVGLLREENDLWQFEYAPAWLSSPHGFDLSPELARERPLHVDGASNRPVQWYFDNLLPEEALRSAIAKDANLNADDAFGLLAHFGAESAGSLVLRDPANHAGGEHGVRHMPLAELSRRIRNLPNAPLTKEAPKRMSLAGAQHKMLVILAGGELYEPLAATPSTQILKPNHQGKEYPASVMNEYFTMRLARRAGLEVPAVHLRYVPEPVYLIDRFDRILPPPADGAPQAPGVGVRRRHVIDTCQLLNKARTFKYSAAHMGTLVDALARCRSKAAARLQLFRWITFNVLVGNGDNHLKNISFLVDAGGINLAPAYDMLCTAAYDTKALGGANGKWPHTELAFALGDARSFGAVTRAHLLEAGAALGLAARTAVRELDRMVSSLPADAELLLASIPAEQEALALACPDPASARASFGGELHMLRTTVKIVIADMCRQLAA